MRTRCWSTGILLLTFGTAVPALAAVSVNLNSIADFPSNAVQLTPGGTGRINYTLTGLTPGFYDVHIENDLDAQTGDFQIQATGANFSSFVLVDVPDFPGNVVTYTVTVTATGNPLDTGQDDISATIAVPTPTPTPTATPQPPTSVSHYSLYE